MRKTCPKTIKGKNGCRIQMFFFQYLAFLFRYWKRIMFTVYWQGGPVGFWISVGIYAGILSLVKQLQYCG